MSRSRWCRWWRRRRWCRWWWVDERWNCLTHDGMFLSCAAANKPSRKTKCQCWRCHVGTDKLGRVTRGTLGRFSAQHSNNPGPRATVPFCLFSILFVFCRIQSERINQLPETASPLALLLFLCLCLFCASLGASPLPALPLKSGSQKATQGRWYGAGTMPAAHTATCPTESTATCDWLDFFQMKMPLISKFGSCCVIWYRPPLP